MFGDPVKNPMGWETILLGDVCEKITDGTHHSPPTLKEGIPYITAKHLKSYGLDFELSPWFVSLEDHQKIYSRCDPKIGDVLYIKDGATTGIAAINYYPFEFSMLSSLALLRPNNSFLKSEFLKELLNNIIFKRYMTETMSGVAIKRLTLKKIKSKKIILPPVEMQEKFSKILSKIEESKIKHQKALKQFENLFQSLQQTAFKGELFDNDLDSIVEEKVLQPNLNF